MTLGPQFEQLGMFGPTVGTGLSDDPTNSERRQKYVDMMSGGKPTRAAKVLFESKVPLKHLHDVATDGVSMESRMMVHNGEYDPRTNDGTGTIRVAHGAAFPNVVVHEFGHALHHVTTKRWMPHEDWLREGYVNDHYNAPVATQPTKEGIATGYSSKYSGEKDDSYDWLETGVMVDGYRIGPFDPGHYRESQKRVVESGDVPHTSRDVASDNPRTSQARQHKAYMGWLDARSNKRRTTQEERLF